MKSNDDILRIYCGISGCNWTQEAMGLAYKAIVSTFSCIGFPPNRLVSQAPNISGIGKTWGSFEHKHKRLENTQFKGVDSFSLAHLTTRENACQASFRKSPDLDWTLYASVRTWWQNAAINWIPELIDSRDQVLFELFKEIAAIGQGRYGSICKRSYRDGQKTALQKKTPLIAEYERRTKDWLLPSTTRVDSLLLLDVFEHNFLSHDHLDAPFGLSGLSLRQWIAAKPMERGKLEYFTDTLTKWTPPKENIPELFEQLFRAGRIYYYRFFCKNNHLQHERLYRPNIFAPWDSPEPIPKIFSAEFRRNLDLYIEKCR